MSRNNGEREVSHETRKGRTMVKEKRRKNVTKQGREECHKTRKRRERGKS
jgi:hypothetical protein